MARHQPRRERGEGANQVHHNDLYRAGAEEEGEGKLDFGQQLQHINNSWQDSKRTKKKDREAYQATSTYTCKQGKLNDAGEDGKNVAVGGVAQSGLCCCSILQHETIVMVWRRVSVCA